jgi:hypothetical protein
MKDKYGHHLYCNYLARIRLDLDIFHQELEAKNFVLRISAELLRIAREERDNTTILGDKYSRDKTKKKFHTLTLPGGGG